MRQVILEINGLEMVSFSPNDFKGRMNLGYSVDGERKLQTVNFDLTRNVENIVASILQFVKSQGEQDVDEDDIVGSLFVKKLMNEEKTEEKLLSFFSKIGEKVRFMKRDKNHTNFMKMFHEVEGSKIILK